METLTFEQVTVLAQQTQSPAISIFLPTHRAFPGSQQDPIRFKNLLQKAEALLIERGMKPRDIEDLMEPARALEGESLFWRYQYDGLAVYLSPGDFHVYHLPFTVDEQVIVAKSYYVKPVLPQFTNNGHFYILAFSQNVVRLFEGTRHSVGEIALPDGVPASFEEALGFDARPDNGMGDDLRKVRLEQYLNRLDASLRATFQETQSPVVLAGVDYLLPIYRTQSEYPQVLAEGITGNPELLRGDELHAQAWPLVEPYFRQTMDAVFDQYRQMVIAHRATDNIKEVVAAAFQGRVDKLVLAVDKVVWGRFDPNMGSVTHLQDEQGADDDLALLDFAAMQTIAKGGTVFALPQAEMRTDSPALAVLRY